MQKIFLATILILMVSTTTTTFAQTSIPEPDTRSEGCTMLDGLRVIPFTSTGDLDQVAFFAGEIITTRITSGGFILFVDGIEVGKSTEGGSVTYTVEANEVFQFSVEAVDTGTVMGTVNFTCSPADSDNDNDDRLTVCHIPPGNPGNAHTIIVGSENAVEAHILHGDYEGQCDEEDESRSDGNNGVITFSDEIAGVVGVFGACVGTDCSEIASADIHELTGLNPETLAFGDSWALEAAEGWRVIIFYLGRHNTDNSKYVFQLNVYHTSLLQDDHLLIIVDYSTNPATLTTDTH